MPAIPANPATFFWTAPHPHHGGCFRPNGKMLHFGAHQNPSAWSSKITLAARIVVGFNVGAEPKYTMEDLIPIVEEVRKRQVGDPSSTFIAQKGIYQHMDGETIVHEDGAQILIIDIRNSKRPKFEKQMVELAEVIAQRLEQEQVIVEIQKNGISQVTMGISPP